MKDANIKVVKQYRKELWLVTFQCRFRSTNSRYLSLHQQKISFMLSSRHIQNRIRTPGAPLAAFLYFVLLGANCPLNLTCWTPCVGVFGTRKLGSERVRRGLEVAGRKNERLIIVARAGGCMDLCALPLLLRSHNISVVVSWTREIQ